MSGKVKLTLVRYRCKTTRELVWMERPMRPALAMEVAKQLALAGHKPTVFSVRVDPDALIASGKVKSCHIVT